MEQIHCKFCDNPSVVKNGFVRGSQRYRCSKCSKTFISRDLRGTRKYSNDTRCIAIKMYLNNCGFRIVATILDVPLSTIFSWIKRAGKIVDEILKTKDHERETRLPA